MFEFVSSGVSDRPEFGEAFDGGGFVLEAVEGTEGGVKIPLGAFEVGAGLLGSVVVGCPALKITEGFEDVLGDGFFCDGGTDAHASRAVAGWGTSVNPVLAVVVGGNDPHCYFRNLSFSRWVENTVGGVA